MRMRHLSFVLTVTKTGPPPLVTKSGFEARLAAQKALWAHKRVCKNVDVLKGSAKLWTSGLHLNFVTLRRWSQIWVTK